MILLYGAGGGPGRGEIPMDLFRKQASEVVGPYDYGEETMGVTKTDFMRGMQCPRMLWLDRHHPELKVIPPFIQDRLNRGNEFGDRMMGIFGPYEEVREYYPGTTRPNKTEMAKKTQELLSAGTKIICEAAFMDEDGNYCAADIIRWDEERKCYIR